MPLKFTAFADQTRCRVPDAGRGVLHVDGEHITDCDTTEVAHRIHQHRDCIVRVEDLDDGSTGVGTLQSNAVGAHPERGLTAEASFA